MIVSTLSEQAEKMYAEIPENGQAIGNVTLRKAFGDEVNYSSVRQELLDATLITTGRGRGGSVRRIIEVPATAELNAVSPF